MYYIYYIHTHMEKCTEEQESMQGRNGKMAFQVRLFARRPEFESLMLTKKFNVATGSCDPGAGRDEAETGEITGTCWPASVGSVGRRW